MDAPLERGGKRRASWLESSRLSMVDDVIDLRDGAHAAAEVDPDPAAIDRERLFAADGGRLIGTGSPKPRNRVLGGKRRRRFLGRR